MLLCRITKFNHSIANYSQHFGRPLLSTLVDITPYNDVIMIIYPRCQRRSTDKTSTSKSKRNVEFQGFPRFLFSFLAFSFTFCRDALISVKISSAVALNCFVLSF